MKNAAHRNLCIAGMLILATATSFGKDLQTEYSLQSPAATVRAVRLQVIDFKTEKRDSALFYAPSFSKEGVKFILSTYPQLIVSAGGERVCGKPRNTWYEGYFLVKEKDMHGSCLSSPFGFKIESPLMRLVFPNTISVSHWPEPDEGLKPAPVIESIRLSQLSEDGSSLILETKINFNGWEKNLSYGSAIVEIREAYQPLASCGGFSVNTSGGLKNAVAKLRSSNLENMAYCQFVKVGDTRSSEYEYDRLLGPGVRTLVMRRDGAIQAYSSDSEVRGPLYLNPTFSNDPAKVSAAKKAADKYTKLVGEYADQILLVGGSSLAEIRQAQKAWLQKNSAGLVAALEETENNLALVSGFEKAIIMMTLRQANKVAEEVERTFAKQMSLDEVIRN